MENNFFLNAGIQPLPPLHFEPQLSMPTWKSLSSAMEIQAMDFDSALSSMASSPAACNSNLSNESFLIGKSHQMNSSGFSRRATSFSCFGSQSFNGRTGLNNGELQHRSSQSLEIGKIPRVSSSPALEGLGLGIQQNKNSPLFANSQQESTVSEQVPSAENGKKASNDLNSRKRKDASRGKAKEPAFSPLADAAKVSEADDNSNAKRFKPNEGNGNENSRIEEEEEEPKQSLNTDQKPPEPPKDFIHVRARRGQATDSHSLAERVRREKIGERMKLLQDLVPGCNKLTGKALMLDEIINYVQSLQRQVMALSMKLAFVDSRPDFNMDSLITKDMFQRNNNIPQPIFPIDSSASAFCGHQLHQSPGPALHSNISNGTVSSLDPLDTALCRNLKYSEVVSQCPTFCEDDLQTIVQMGFGQNLNWENSIAITELLPL